MTPAPDFAYAGNPNYLEDSYQAYVKTLTEIGWYDRDLYVLDQSLGSFDRALKILSAHADKLLVVTMPDTTIWDEPNLWAKQAYESVIIRHEGMAYAEAYMDSKFGEAGRPLSPDRETGLYKWAASGIVLIPDDKLDPYPPATRLAFWMGAAGTAVVLAAMICLLR